MTSIKKIVCLLFIISFSSLTQAQGKMDFQIKEGYIRHKDSLMNKMEFKDNEWYFVFKNDSCFGNIGIDLVSKFMHVSGMPFVANAVPIYNIDTARIASNSTIMFLKFKCWPDNNERFTKFEFYSNYYFEGNKVDIIYISDYEKDMKLIVNRIN